MKHGVSLGLALVLSAAAQAAEPERGVSAPAPAAPQAVIPKSQPAKPLDLRIGEVRKYMMPNEYREVLGAPDADENIVVVQGRAPPLLSERPVPGGLMSLWYAATKPSQAWRIFVPDPKAASFGPPDSKVPPPIFRWGP